MSEYPTMFRPLPLQPDHPCIGCGHANPHGLQMEFHTDETCLISRLEVPEHMCGWFGMAHGGTVSTILDEVMGNAALYLLERIVMTVSFRAEFLKPVRIGRPIQAQSRLLERIGDRKATMISTIFDDEGDLCAEARGTFSLFTAEAARKLHMDERMVEDFEHFLQSCGKP
jgi:uncharacterized protein (TIGR00369 family)